MFRTAFNTGSVYSVATLVVGATYATSGWCNPAVDWLQLRDSDTPAPAWSSERQNPANWVQYLRPELKSTAETHGQTDTLLGIPVFRAAGRDHSVGIMQIVSRRLPGNRIDQDSDFSRDLDRDRTVVQGMRLGWLGRLSEHLTATLSAQSSLTNAQTASTPLATRSTASVQPMLAAGFSYAMTSDLAVEFEWQRVFRDDKTGSAHEPTAGSVVAAYADRDIYRVGLNWRYKPGLRVTAGLDRTAQPYRTDATTDDAPRSTATRTRASLGLSYRLNEDNLFSLSYSHALQQQFADQHTAVFSAPSALGLTDRHEVEVIWGMRFD